MRILSATDIRSAISMPEVIEAVKQGFIALSAGEAIVPIRGVLQSEAGITLTMPAQVGPSRTVKVVSIYPENAARNIPTIHAAVLVLDAETGEAKALMDGSVLTAMRTGAASGVATNLLARDDAKILAVIGSGVQARTQIEAICAVRPIEAIRVYSPNNPHKLINAIQAEYPDIMFNAPDSTHEALYGADILVAATNAKTPVIHLADVSPGAHINGVGSFTPTMREVASDVVLASRVVVDHRESIWEEAGDLIIPRDADEISEEHIYAEIGEIAADKLPGRQSPDEITFFKSVGNAVQDAVTAARILAVAEEKGLGTEVQL